MNAPKPPDQPLDSFLRRLEQQLGAGQCDEGFEHDIQLLVLVLGHLRPVLDFALLAEQALGELQEPGIQRTQVPEAFVA
jgi:hypothetical protein